MILHNPLGPKKNGVHSWFRAIIKAFGRIRRSASPTTRSASGVDSYSVTYAPVIAATFLGIGFIAATLLIANLLAPRVRTRVKESIYECGMPTIGQGWSQMNLRYYLYAIVFLIFEIESVFLFPWTVVYKGLGPFAFWEMMLFMSMLLFGLVYAWRKGVLTWE
ncbi:MAG: NADH-quinone oxidoreductase subunit A [Chloroflexi bacterium]|nr:NADH-quinone oxidoreductase subunit A [Chloroflexota bacterium]